MGLGIAASRVMRLRHRSRADFTLESRMNRHLQKRFVPLFLRVTRRREVKADTSRLSNDTTWLVRANNLRRESRSSVYIFIRLWR